MHQLRSRVIAAHAFANLAFTNALICGLSRAFFENEQNACSGVNV